VGACQEEGCAGADRVRCTKTRRIGCGGIGTERPRQQRQVLDVIEWMEMHGVTERRR
jgi:hypothetical protein